MQLNTIIKINTAISESTETFMSGGAALPSLMISATNEEERSVLRFLKGDEVEPTLSIARINRFLTQMKNKECLLKLKIGETKWNLRLEA